jgi:hypothetical protein
MKKKKRSQLIKEADKLFSLYVRLKYADKDGMVKCYTCTGVYPYKKIHNGHYIPRGVKYMRWELDNMRPQCILCNLRRYGNSYIFRENLVAELGEARVKEMEQQAKQLFLEKDAWIEAKIEEVKKLSTVISST